LKKPTSSVRFWFYKHETKKTEPNPNPKKPEKTESNQFKPVFVLKNRTETGWFEPVLFFKKNQFGYFFYIKTKPNRKLSPLVYGAKNYILSSL